MISASPNWDRYHSLLAVLHGGSFSAAARALGIKQSTVSRQIAALEIELGLTLFSRSQKGLRPTDAALRLRPHLDALKRAADALARDAGTVHDSVAGTVRLTTNEPIGLQVLPKTLAKLGERYPLVQFEISISDKTQNLLQREADIAIRVGATRQQAILVTRVGEIEMGLFGSRDYLKRNPAPKTIQDIDRHRLVAFDAWTSRVVRVMGLPELFARDDIRFASDHESLQRALLDAGCGLAFCLADRTRTDRVRVLAESVKFRAPVSIAMHEDLKADRKFRTVFRELAAAFKGALRGMNGS